MIFDFKPVHNITDDEIIDLVQNHICERQHLEFKITLNLKEDNHRLEILHDIISFANSGGGYIIIGIRDDGKGKAQKFEPDLVGDIEKIKQIIMSLCQDYISERIEGLEIVPRRVKENPIVLIRIPDSERIPHMAAYNNRTDFFARYQDGKREMRLGEIKEAFTKDVLSLRLSRIEELVSDAVKQMRTENQQRIILEKIEKGILPELSTLTEQNLLVDISNRKFESEIGLNPYFRIAITPKDLSKEIIELDSLAIIDLLQKPPGSRRNGWNMENSNDTVHQLGLSTIYSKH